jgi:formylglycine-generating enzyme required for sulfatase activity
MATPTLDGVVEAYPTLPPQVEIITDTFSVPMVLVPAGPFVMGSEEVLNSHPHTVILDEYYIDRYEVTTILYADFINEVGNQEEDGVYWLSTYNEDSHLKQVDGIWIPVEGYADHPVVKVTWYGAAAFCEWRGARLPTEAEWEKAARGTDERTYPWGENVSCEIANYRDCRIRDSVPVGSYPFGVSNYGVHDMAGNVAEWTADWYADDYYANSPPENPTGPSTGEVIASRGGSWYSTSTYLRTYHRNNEFSPRQSLSNVGFRCVVSSLEK